MKNILMAVLFILLVTISSADASPRTGERPKGICTSDFNLWGQSSQCSCENNMVYDQRTGLCLTGEDGKKITVQGAISSGVVAIGGETTGFVIKTRDEGSYELFLNVADQEKLTRLGELWFEVEGELIVIESVEIKNRQAIIVEKLGVLE